MQIPAHQKSSKSIKKTAEEQLDEAANEEQGLMGEDSQTSEEDSETEVIDKKSRKATAREKPEKKEKKCALRVNIKHTKGQSQHSSYRSYNTRTRGRGRKWRKKVSMTQARA